MLNELNYKAAAEHVGMREGGFRKLCRDGKGPKARRDGREVRFLTEHLDAWLEEYKANAYSTAATKTVKTNRAAPKVSGGTKAAPKAAKTNKLPAELV